MTKVEGCQLLLLNNERDQSKLGRYRTNTCRTQAAQALRIERELLLDELERLTGRREFRIDEIAAALPSKSEDGGGDPPKDKEPVRV